jgi:hypothetical protein
MKQKAYIKPSKPALIIGLIAVIGFLAFGIFFFVLLNDEPESGIGQGFLLFWMLMVILIGAYFVYSLVNYNKTEAAGAGGELHIPGIVTINDSSSSFDEKLRKLEELKKDGLINEEEYQNKRKEILKDKW